MTIEITIQVPDHLEERIRQMQDRLPEALERGLQAMMTEQSGNVVADENKIINVLTSQPDPQTIMALRPSPEFQERVSTLLTRNKERLLADEELLELERALWLEHLVRLAKANAWRQLQTHHE